MRLLLLCDGKVGEEIALWLFENYPDDIGAVVTIRDTTISSASRLLKIPTVIYTSEAELIAELSKLSNFDLGILAWWPKIISAALIKLPERGFINTHPSFLPHARGKHYNFWTLVEQCPFGATLHYVDEGIDSGDIVAQLPIDYGWEDTGESLYIKATQGIVNLFKARYPALRALNFPRQKQDLSIGSLHYASELDSASQIHLDQNYSARNLINLLRARTFTGYPACWFSEGGVSYEITVTIRRKSR